MSALGADPGKLDDLARDLDQLAGLLDHRRMSLTVWIEGDRFWRGHRANDFRHAWEHQFSPQISQAVNYLHDAVRTLHDNANQQRVASGESPKDYGSTGFLTKLFGEGVHAVEAVPSAVSDLASVLPSAVDTTLHRVGTAVTLAGAGTLLVEMSMIRGLGAVGNDLSTLWTAKDIVETGRVLGPLAKVLGVTGLALDGTNMINDVVQGKGWHGDLVSLTIDAVATKNPYVAVGKASYDVSHWFFTDTMAGKAVVDANVDASFAVGMHSVGGDPTVDPGAASRLAHRYDGVGGFVNFAHDEFAAAFGG